MTTSPHPSIELERVIRATNVHIATDRFAYLQVERLPNPNEYLMCFSNGDDKTVVARENLVQDSEYSAIEVWFRLITFWIPTPFESPGFLAVIASALAVKGINLLIISTFPGDYVLVRDQDLESATAALRCLGFQIPSPS